MLGAGAVDFRLKIHGGARIERKGRRTMNTKLPDNVLAALTVTQRATGWNFRPADTIQFDLPNADGTACRLLVVPYRRWASRRWELQGERQHRHGGNAA